MFESWVHLSTPPGIIDHVGTREVVQDYDMIREALGYDKIHFLGAS
jgi:pimeloyl-ACP methyl ester carboxylesterase